MKKHFKFQLEYNDWANSSVIETMIAAKEIPQRGNALISHIICTQDIWLDRVIGKSKYEFGLWDEYSLFECRSLSKLSTEKWLKFLKRTSEKDLREEFEYTNSKNENYTITLEYAFAHIVTHSSYHRAQINHILKSVGIAPPEIDQIYFARK